jgi:hypothetical protein
LLNAPVRRATTVTAEDSERYIGNQRGSTGAG